MESILNYKYKEIKPAIRYRHWLQPYVPGILLFFIALIITLFTYRDYGITWDERDMRNLGLLTYSYITHSSQALFYTDSLRYYGAGFEFPLVIIERCLRLSDFRDIYLLRHLLTNIFFLLSAFSMYVLAYRLFKNKFIACLAFIMIVCAPRIYAHSFFNTRDVPFLSMFLVTLCFFQLAFEKDKKAQFFILGMLSGYTTGIRVMGIMLACFIILFLLIDLFTTPKTRENIKSGLLKILLFSFGFCLSVYMVWPYLWLHPIHNFIDSYTSFSRFQWNGTVLLNGKIEHGYNLPLTYFPTWFLVSNPELWLLAGFSGIILIIVHFFKHPLDFLKNTHNRNFLLYLTCFIAPILAVIILHSIIYNDWRHLYFVYPPFVLMGLYVIHILLQTKYKPVVQALCMLQTVLILFFMIGNHPFSQIYFNNLVSHKEEYLVKNYEFEYWGSGFIQGLNHILQTDSSKTIKVNGEYKKITINSILLLPKDLRKRVQYADMGDADYVISGGNSNYGSNLPGHKIVYSIQVLNSTVLRIYKPGKRQ